MNKILIFLICIILSCVADKDNDWNEFKNTFKKNYNDVEVESFRRKIFNDNLDYITKHNQRAQDGFETYTLGINSYSDWTPQEWSKLLGAKPLVESKKVRDVSEESVESEESGNNQLQKIKGPRKVRDVSEESVESEESGNNQLQKTKGSRKVRDVSEESVESEESGKKAIKKRKERKIRAILPTSIDWRTKGAVTPVKNQGSCGSCWAFAAVAALEAQYYFKSGKLVSLSEEQLVDCVYTTTNGCEGGWMYQAFDYVKANGIEDNVSYPYASSKYVSSTSPQTCFYDQSKTVTKSSSTIKLTPNKVSDLLNALANVGPVAVGLDASSRDFQSYKSGVLKPKSRKTTINHGVTIVGYGIDHYIVKNSWGSSWGDNGYIKIYRSPDGVTSYDAFGIEQVPSYPLL